MPAVLRAERDVQIDLSRTVRVKLRPRHCVVGDEIAVAIERGQVLGARRHFWPQQRHSLCLHHWLQQRVRHAG